MPPQQMEEASNASSSSDEESNSEGNAAVFATSGQVCRIESNVFLGINTVSNPENLVYTTLDWEHVNDDPMHKQHHDMFTHFFDAETCQLMDPDGLHPFCLASKLNADDYLSFREILHMDKKLAKNGVMPWIRNFKTYSNQEPSSLSVGTKYSNRARKLFQQDGLFGRNVILPEKSTVSRHECAFTEICNAKIIQTMKHLHQWWNGQR